MKRNLFYFLIILAVVLVLGYYFQMDGEIFQSSEEPAADDSQPSADQLAENVDLESLRELGFQDNVLTPAEAEFELRNLENEAVTGDDFRGSWVLMKFWSTSCILCMEEMPKLEEFYGQLESYDFELVAVNLEDRKETIKEVRDDYGLSFTLLKAPSRQKAMQIADNYPLRVYPSAALITPEGRPIMKKYGFSYWNDDEFISHFKQLFSD